MAVRLPDTAASGALSSVPTTPDGWGFDCARLPAVNVVAAVPALSLLAIVLLTILALTVS